MNITVGIFSKRKGFSQDMADIITGMGHTCTILPSFGKLVAFAKNTPDLKLLLLDEQTFPTPHYDLQKYVIKHGYRFAVHFFSELMASNMTLDRLEYNAYYEIIQEIRPMLRRNRDYYQILTFKGPKFSSEEKELLHRYNLRPGHVILLKYLNSHIGRYIHLDSMSRYLWPQSKTEHIDTLYTYIHQMRDILPILYPNMVIDRLSNGIYCYHDTLDSTEKEVFWY